MVIYYDLSKLPKKPPKEGGGQKDWVIGLNSLIPNFIYRAFPDRNFAHAFANKFCDCLQSYYENSSDMPFLSRADFQTLSEIVLKTFSDEQRNFHEPEVIAQKFAAEFEYRTKDFLEKTEYPPQTGIARIAPIIRTFKRECGQSQEIVSIAIPNINDDDKSQLRSKLASRWNPKFADKFVENFHHCLVRWLAIPEVDGYADSMDKILTKLRNGAENTHLAPSFNHQKKRLIEHTTIKLDCNGLEEIASLVLAGMEPKHTGTQYGSRTVPPDCTPAAIRRIIQEIYPPSPSNEKPTDINRIIDSFSETLHLRGSVRRLIDTTLTLHRDMQTTAKGTLP